MKSKKKNQISNPTRYTHLILTSEDWYSSFTKEGRSHEGKGDPYVQISVLEFLDGMGWRVCLWGNDDTGMDKDFLYKDDVNARDNAFDLYHLTCQLSPLTRKDLIELGYKRA